MSETSEAPYDEISWEFLIQETAAIVERQIAERHAVGKYTTKALRNARVRLAEEQGHLADPEYLIDGQNLSDLAREVIEPYNHDRFVKSSRAQDYEKRAHPEPTDLG